MWGSLLAHDNVAYLFVCDIKSIVFYNNNCLIKVMVLGLCMIRGVFDGLKVRVFSGDL